MPVDAQDELTRDIQETLAKMNLPGIAAIGVTISIIKKSAELALTLDDGIKEAQAQAETETLLSRFFAKLGGSANG